MESCTDFSLAGPVILRKSRLVQITPFLLLSHVVLYKNEKEEDLGRALVAEMLVTWHTRYNIMKRKYLQLCTKMGQT